MDARGAGRWGSLAAGVLLVAWALIGPGGSALSTGSTGSAGSAPPAVATGALAGITTHPTANRPTAYRLASTARHSEPASAVEEPAYSRQPGAAFVGACQDVASTATSQRRCEAAALPAFDAARATEGIGPLELPTGFATDPAPVQLLTLIDLERVDRGLPAVPSLSAYLDSLAEWGAFHGSDPPLPAGRVGGSNWAGGLRSTLLSTFLWMYDDGPGSSNIDCPTAGAPGCWGHRRNILATYPDPALMGASSEGRSLAMLVVAGGGLARTGPSWASLAAADPVALSARSLDAVAPARHIAGVHVTMWGTASATLARLAIVGGGNDWHLVGDTCGVVPGGHCNIWVAYRPTSSAASSAELVIEAAGGRRIVALHGRA